MLEDVTKEEKVDYKGDLREENESGE